MGLFRRKKKDSFTPGSILSADSSFAFAESYKRLRTNFLFATMNGQLRKIMVTSAIPSENKSSTSINLAISLAETEAKVVVVDCDLRKSNVRRYLYLEEEHAKGLSNVIAGGAELDECIYAAPNHGFSVLPAGSIPPNPAELLSAARMGEILDTLAERFDFVICDTAPVNVVADAINVSRYCDGVLMTVRQGYTKKDEVRRAKDALDSVGAKVLGTILVRVSDKNSAKSYRGGGYYSRYGRYARRYGYDSYGYGGRHSK